jgi:FAD/FMN-containing dehydrogenase
VPGTGGAVVVDLSEMKKIIHIDRKHRVAMFEPGVTFSELSTAVAKEGLRLNIPLLPRQSKSVVGSMLEREPVLMSKYHWDIADPLSCTEIIFGTGDMFRTGSAAGSGTIEEQWAAGGVQKEAAGPSSASWYRMIQGSQGGMGIVTWASARCELIPTLENPYFFTSPDLEKILEALHWLIRLRLVNECLVLNNSNFAQINSVSGLKQNLPLWILCFNIAAYDFLPEERLEGQTADMKDVAQRLGLEPVKTAGGVAAERFLKLIQNPSEEPYWKLRDKGGCEDILFLTIYDKLAEQIEAMYAAAEAAGYPGTDLGIYLQPIVQGVNCHCEFSLFYDPSNAVEAERIRELSATATRKLLSRGAFFSRPYGEAAGLIMNRDAASKEALKRVKDIADPLGIMNPSKLFV